MSSSGVVYLVGAGPGDPGLLTCKGRSCIERADVIIYDGLVATELLALAREDAICIYAGKKRSDSGAARTQEDINQLLVDHASAGKVVVRLKGGDPFVFGRGAEECLELRRAGIRFEVVPGVSAATAVSAYAGIPLTTRQCSASAILVTGHEMPGKESSDVDWKAVAGAGTVVLFMARKRIRECVDALLEAGRAGGTPAAAIHRGTTARQRTLIATLETLPELLEREEIRPPVLIIIGAVVEFADELRWYEDRPLFGRRILLTRDAERGAELARMLEALGAQVSCQAFTHIVDPEPAAKEALRDALGADARWNWLLLTSANACAALARAMSEAGVDARVFCGTKIACVGPKTSEALGRLGLRADLVAARGNSAALAEEMLATGEALGRVLFPRASSGRRDAIDALEAAGAEITLIDAYGSKPVPADEPSMRETLRALRSGHVDAAVFFAPSQLRALREQVSDADEILAAVPVLGAIGSTTKKALEDMGLQVAAVPKSPSVDQLRDALVRAFGES